MDSRDTRCSCERHDAQCDPRRARSSHHPSTPAPLADLVVNARTTRLAATLAMQPASVGARPKVPQNTGTVAGMQSSTSVVAGRVSAAAAATAAAAAFRSWMRRASAMHAPACRLMRTRLSAGYQPHHRWGCGASMLAGFIGCRRGIMDASRLRALAESDPGDAYERSLVADLAIMDRPLPGTVSNQKLVAFCQRVNACRSGECRKESLSDLLKGEHAEVVTLFMRYVQSYDDDVLEVGGGIEAAEVSAVHRTLQILGRRGSRNSAVLALISIGAWHPHHDIRWAALATHAVGSDGGFSEAAEREATALLRDGVPADADGDARLDLTHLATFAIDDATAREIDDGMSIQALPGGFTKVWVHIADPTRVLDLSSAIVAAAARKGQTLYHPTLPEMTVPMLPWALTQELFSLRGGVACPALSVGVTLEEATGVITSFELCETIVRPRVATYDDVDALMASCREEEEPELFALDRIARVRELQRVARGATPEAEYQARGSRGRQPKLLVRLEGTKDGKGAAEEGRCEVTLREDGGGEGDAGPSQRIVRECMILANEVAGLWGQARDLPLPYRGQRHAEDFVFAGIDEHGAPRQKKHPASVTFDPARATG